MMTFKILVAAILAAFVVPLGIGATGSAASAQDRRPCVSNREFVAMWDMKDVRLVSFDKARLENRWDVRYRGWYDPSQSSQRLEAYVYKACAYAGGWVTVWYVRHDRSVYALMQVIEGQRHGHPRVASAA